MQSIRKIFRNIDEHTFDVLLKSFYSVIVKVAGMCLALFSSILLGRELGVEGIGVLELVLRITTFLMILAAFGMPQVILKEISIAFVKRDWLHVRNTMFSSIIFNGSLAALISIILYFSSSFLSNEVFGIPDLLIPLRIMSICIFFQTLSQCYAAGVNAFGKVWQSNLVDQSLSMLILVIFLLLSKYFFNQISLKYAAYAYLLARVGVTIAIGGYWQSIFRIKKFSSSAKKFQKHFFKPASHLLISNGSTIIISSVSTIFLGILSTTEEVGLFNIASRIALLTIVFLKITNSAISPKIASLYKQDKLQELQKLLSRISFLLLFVGIFFFILFVLFGKSILGLWGDDFQKAYLYLIILAIGQLVNISTGAVGLILIMTGYEKVISKISFIFMMCSLLLNILFIYYFGGIGACIATTIILVLENLTRLYYVKKFTGLSTINL